MLKISSPPTLMPLTAAAILLCCSCSEAAPSSIGGESTAGSSGSAGTGAAQGGMPSSAGGAPGGAGAAAGAGEMQAAGGGMGVTGGGGSSGSSGNAGASGGGAPANREFDFQELGGVLVFEAEHFRRATTARGTQWVAFDSNTPVFTDCAKNITCPAPDGHCNQYPDCDDDQHAAAQQSGGAYVEVLPNRRRDDHEPGTGGLGFTDSPAEAAQLWYRVKFNQSGRYYGWVRGYGKGPADNGLWLGITEKDEITEADFRPDYDLPDYAGLRFQFKPGWQWQNCRRGQAQHTGVSGCSVEENMLIEIPSPGVYNIVIAMREDGVDIDKFYFSKTPQAPSSLGPEETK